MIKKEMQEYIIDPLKLISPYRYSPTNYIAKFFNDVEPTTNFSSRIYSNTEIDETNRRY